VLRSNYLLTPAQKADAREALKLLEGTDITLTEAARRAVKGQRALRRVTFMAAVDEFVLVKIRSGARHATVEWYEERLRPMADVMGEQIFDTINRAELKDTLESLFPTAPARAASARACRALWRWGMHTELAIAGADITMGLDFKGKRPAPAVPVPRPHKVLSIAQSQAIIDGLPERFFSALGCALGGGIRPEELAGPHKEALRWEHISTTDKIIRVPGEISKTGKPRVLENLPPLIWRFLQPRGLTDAVCPGTADAMLQWVKKLGGFKARRHEGPPWPHDALRHTFATYALALTQDPGQVAMWLGHEGKPELLMTTYRGERSADGMITQALAKKFFALRRRRRAG
jgi:integrase